MSNESSSEKTVEAASLKHVSAPGLRPISRRRPLVILAVVLGVLLIALASFALGFSAGIHKARFSYRFGENYERNFVNSKDRGMKDRMLREMDGKPPFRSGHGVAGEVLSIVDRTIALRGPEGQENTVQVTDSTIYNKGKDQVNLEAVAIGDRIVVLGKPSDEGLVVADLIRVFDPSMQPGGWMSKRER